MFGKGVLRLQGVSADELRQVLVFLILLEVFILVLSLLGDAGEHLRECPCLLELFDHEIYVLFAEATAEIGEGGVKLEDVVCIRED